MDIWGWNLEDELCWPAYDPKIWKTRKEWIQEQIEMGYYWITDYYDEDGNVKGSK